ncbi:iron(III) transport system permease protein [Acidiphilium sp. MT5]
MTTLVRHRRSISARLARSGGLIALVLIVALFIVPLLRLLALPLLQPSMPSAGWQPVWDSLSLAILTALIAAPLGGLIAWFITDYRGVAATLANVTLWALFLAPSYVLTTGWIILFSTPQTRLSLFGRAFFGLPGLIMLFVIKALPFASFVARSTVAGAGAGLREAALIHNLPPLRRLLIIARLIAPALALAFAVAVIETMQEFGIPATLGTASKIPLLTYAIYQNLAETPTDFAGAALLCWRLVLIAALFGLASLALQRRGANLRNGRNRMVQRRSPSPALSRLALSGIILLLTLGIVIPFCFLLLRGFSHGWQPTPHLNPILRSLGFGLIGATLATATGVALLQIRAQRRGLITTTIDAALLANMAVPGLVLGAGYILTFNNNILPLYGTTTLLIIAYAAGTIPLAARMVQGAFADLDRNLAAAARIHGLSASTRAIDINATLLAQPLLYGLLVATGAIMFELPISELLYPPGATPLGVAIVGLDQMGDLAAAARLAVLGMVAMIALACALLLIVRLLTTPRGAARA